MSTPTDNSPLCRRCWRLRGQVQGVGFRPFVYRLAQEHHVTGLIRNDTRGVTLEAQGAAEQLERFARDLIDHPPPLARYQEVACQPIAVVPGETGFAIQESVDDRQPRAGVTPDTAVCPDCLRELFDPADRRRGYALINCTHCGPRYSIIRQVPYDRPNTTMAGFVMCPECAAEYAAVDDRRFHAQPIACPRCGPRVSLVDPRGRAMVCGDPIAEAAKLLLAGRIVAIKGLGGFHLAVRADDETAVRRLRERKKRDHKPFAVMCASLEQARALVTLSDAAAAAMGSPACPIVLAPRRAGGSAAAEGALPGALPGVAPGNHRLGVMLPYTPLQHLLFGELSRTVGWALPTSLSADVPVVGGAHPTTDPPINQATAPPLVMTSGNQSDEPLVIDNDEAVERLGGTGLCDAILWHDRPIERCVDDSVLLDLGDGPPLPIRRARGYAPQGQVTTSPYRHIATSPHPGLCVGGELKNTVAVVRDGEVILSQHLGDLTHALAFQYFKRAIEDLCALFGVAPAWIAHDLHPAYLSTAYARQLAGRWCVPTIAVQHHHAHAAAVLAEHGHAGPALAVVCDGTGYGPDGTIWGGELLRVEGASFQRLAHLAPLRLPGGDAAAKDTRRCALALLHQAYGDEFVEHPLARRMVPDASERDMLCRMLMRDLHCASSSGAGRVFDGVAALLGLCDYNHFEAQAALKLEAVACEYHRRTRLPAEGGWGRAFDAPDWQHGGVAGADPRTLSKPRPLGTDNAGACVIDLSPVIRAILAGVEGGQAVGELAAFFHEQLARALDAAAGRAAEVTGLRVIGLSGGVFCNQILTQRLTELLQARSLTVLRHQQVPPNDGGIAFGQAAIAVASMSGSLLNGAPSPDAAGR